jgi:hypothetical protein
LDLDLKVAAIEPRVCNYIYTSYWDDWVAPTSIIDLILVLLYEIGEATWNGRSHRELLENGTFFLRGVYVPRSSTEFHESLETLPLPELTDRDWPVPDMHTSEAFRLKLAADIAAVVKCGTGSKAAHVQWFLPIHVMTNLFAVAENVRRTQTMYKFTYPLDALFRSLLDDGWNTKYQIGQDQLKCVVSRNTVVFRYHVIR